MTTVPARPCQGRLTEAGVPRHPRPTGFELDLSFSHIVDYVPDTRIRQLSLAPIADALAAIYDGCPTCLQQSAAVITADTVLLAHLVGTALLTLDSIPPVPGEAIRYRLGYEFSAIALTVRHYGLPHAVRVADSLTLDDREKAAKSALNELLSLAWLTTAASVGVGGKWRPRVDPTDQQVLAELRELYPAIPTDQR